MSKPAEQKIELPPRPERQELPQAQTIADLVFALNYYEHLLQEWETWGETTTRIVKNKNDYK